MILQSNSFVLLIFSYLSHSLIIRFRYYDLPVFLSVSLGIRFGLLLCGRNCEGFRMVGLIILLLGTFGLSLAVCLTFSQSNLDMSI